MTPIHHRNPQHPTFIIFPSNIQELDVVNAQHYLQLAIQPIAYQSDKIDQLKTQLFFTHQFANAVHKKLYHKEHKKELTGTEKLAAKGSMQ